MTKAACFFNIFCNFDIFIDYRFDNGYNRFMKEYNNKFHFNQAFYDKEKLYGNLRLIQTGDLQCSADSVVPEHNQYCFEITYAVSGRGICKSNDTEYALKKGDIHISLKSDRHTIVADPDDPLRYFFLAVEPLLEHPLYQPIKNLEAMLTAGSRVAADRFNISDIFVRLLSEFFNARPFADVLIEACVNQILSYVLLSFNLSEYAYRPQNSDKESLVYAVVRYIDENCLTIKSVQEVFAKFNYAESTVSHGFSHLMGKTVKRYLCDCKLVKAEEFLKNKQYSVTQIAELLDFSSIHAFTRAFKQKYSLSPTAYAKLISQ